VEVILADDGSVQPLAYLDAEYRGRMNLIVVRQDPLGPAAARNAGIKNSSAGIVIFLDSDVQPQAGWFEAIIGPLEKNPALAGVEGKTISTNLTELNPFSHFLYNLEGGAYLTCNIAYRREWLDWVNGFDERFRQPWREDSDLAFSILELGGQIIFAPEAVVDHPVRPVRLKRMFWFYPIRRGYDWLLMRKHPEIFRQKNPGIWDRSEITFFLAFLVALILFIAGWTITGFIVLLFHQAIYNHLLLRRLHMGAREAYNMAVPWKIFAKAYPFFYLSPYLTLGAVFWGWIKFMGVKPSLKKEK